MNNFKQENKYIVKNNEEDEFEKLIDGIYTNGKVDFTPVEINPFQVTRRSIIKPSDEFIKREKERNAELLSKKFQLNYDVNYVQIDKLTTMDSMYIKFKEYTEDEFCNLYESIKKYGLFTPLIVWENSNENYYILSGIERWKVYIGLYTMAEKSNNEEFIKKYETIPCYVIKKDDIDDLRARDIMLDSNLCSRKIDPISFRNAVSNKIALKLKEKEMKSELGIPSNSNIMDEVSEELMRSKPTLYGYRKLENLCKGAAFLLQQKRISLKSAKKLAKYSNETQVTLINSIGIEKINDLKISILNIKDENNKREVANAIMVIKAYEIPFKSTVTINFATKFGKVIIEKLQHLLSKLPKEYLVKVRFPKFLI